MKINSALVGASCINCLNSRGDSILASKGSDRGFESHSGKTFFIFFLCIFSNFFSKKSQKNILKMNFRQWGTVWSVAIWRITNFQIFWMKNRLLSQCAQIIEKILQAFKSSRIFISFNLRFKSKRFYLFRLIYLLWHVNPNFDSVLKNCPLFESRHPFLHLRYKIKMISKSFWNNL